MTGPEPGGTATIEIPKLESKATEADALPPFSLDGDDGGAEPQPEKRGPGRPKKYASGAEKRRARAEREAAKAAPPPPPPPMDPQEKEAMAGLVGLGFTLLGQFLAQRRGPHWLVGSDEAATYGEYGVKALEPFGLNLGRWTGLVAFAGLVVVGAAKRVKVDMENAQLAKGPKPATTEEMFGSGLEGPSDGAV